MADNRPRGRKRNVSGQGTGVNLRGDGLGTGPVGSTGGTSGGGPTGGGSAGDDKGLLSSLAGQMLGGGGSLGGLLGGGSSGGSSSSYSPTGNNWNVQEDYTASSGDSNFNFYNSSYSGNGSLSTGGTGEDASQTDLNTEVASGSREKL